MPRSTESFTSPISTLRRAAAEHLPLPALDAESYATGHAAFEARSDQRDMLTAWLRTRLRPREGGPVRVLSVGCGDGSVDVVVAAGLAAAGGAVAYDGVEPFSGSATAWAARLGEVDGALSNVQQVAFADHAAPDEAYDVVVFVHSLYYVPDVEAALRQAVTLLAPGGELIVLHAPRAELNAVVDVLAPSTGGHPQWFSDRVTGALRALGLPSGSERLHARLDLTGADTDVLDFTVQAFLPPALRGPVREHLAAVALPGPGVVVAHPIDAFTVRLPG